MNNQTPTAQSGPSDRAIAQAFREAKQQFGGRGRWQSNSEWIDWRASEIDAKHPPAGARDAVTDEMVERAEAAREKFWETDANYPATEAEFNSDPAKYDKLAMRAALEAALTGKADGDHGHAAASDDLATKEVLVPCDCSCGRQCCAACGNDLGFITQATQPAAPGAGDGEIQATLDTFAAIHASDKFTVDAARDAFAGVESVRAQVNPRQTNTAATGMGVVSDAMVRRGAVALNKAICGWDGLIQAERAGLLSKSRTVLEAALAAQPAPTVDAAIAALVDALARSKGWLRDYAEAIIRDAIDRRGQPEAAGGEPVEWRVKPPGCAEYTTDAAGAANAKAQGFHVWPKLAAPVVGGASELLEQLRSELAADKGWDYTEYEKGRLAEKERVISQLALLSARPAESVVGDVDGVARLLADAAGHGMREKCEPLARQIVELLAARPGGDGSCLWRFDGMWESACGVAWEFNNDGPEENNYRFCHGCGKPIAHPAQAGGGAE